uniref:Uncharacterized protein n=1 Tax=Anguilla anguilla TaxID=7936 RepID=A0A0E9S9R7_ANGAN
MLVSTIIQPGGRTNLQNQSSWVHGWKKRMAGLLRLTPGHSTSTVYLTLKFCGSRFF